MIGAICEKLDASIQAYQIPDHLRNRFEWLLPSVKRPVVSIQPSVIKFIIIGIIVVTAIVVLAKQH